MAKINIIHALRVERQYADMAEAERQAAADREQLLRDEHVHELVAAAPAWADAALLTFAQLGSEVARRPGGARTIRGEVSIVAVDGRYPWHVDGHAMSADQLACVLDARVRALIRACAQEGVCVSAIEHTGEYGVLKYRHVIGDMASPVSVPSLPFLRDHCGSAVCQLDRFKALLIVSF